MKPSRFAGNRNNKRAGQNTFHIFLNTDLEGFIDDLKGDYQAAVRPAAQAGAEVLYKAVLQNVASIGSKTGNLAGAIYQKFSPENSGPGYATYHVSWRTSDAALADNGQPIRTGLPVAPHGHLVEFGHIQRYASYIGSDGEWHTAVRPEMRGKKKPKRSASQAEKDAYYVLRKGGPIQVAAQPFIRPAALKYPEAVEAAKAKMLEVLGV